MKSESVFLDFVKKKKVLVFGLILITVFLAMATIQVKADNKKTVIQTISTLGNLKTDTQWGNRLTMYFSTIKMIKDNPLLSCRVAGLEKRSPSKIVLDNKLRIPINSRIIKDNSKYNTIIFYNKINRKKIKSLNNLGIKLYKIPLDK